ncbi:hypothetical protein [Litorihabitans aurantiacus]|uniref:Excalibur calcium-binding domain-containing protein n=1 Tax=Litorihabitans aurantiacus TaxID=1930061 RepID=A0AA37UGV5_9MICO|nr:hypothetical protein [Litorihabitans aurantiacus]GMA30423.1 hypothetical protein GCM10025875_04150 [Litorihabitans aurantiacus]
MSAPSRPTALAGRRRLLLAVVPLLVLVVAAVLVLGGARTDRPAADGGSSSPHAGHSPSAPVDSRDEADGDAGPTATPGADDPATTATPGPAPSPTGTPVPDPPAPPDGHAMAAPTQTGLLEVANAPAAEVRSGADALGEPRGAIDPSEVVESAASLGGCHPGYGAAGQCLPLIPPSMAAHAAEMVDAGLELSSMPHPWTCTELLTYFPDGIAVRAGSDPAEADPFGLDLEGDGVACVAA